MSLETLSGLTGHSKGWLSKIENGHAGLERRQDIVAMPKRWRYRPTACSAGLRPRSGRTARCTTSAAAKRTARPVTEDPPDIPARPVSDLRVAVQQADASLRAADHAAVIRLLGSAISELCVHAATAGEPDRAAALRLLIRAYGSDGTCALRQIGETNLAWIVGERAWQAAGLLGDPVWKLRQLSGGRTLAAPRTSPGD